jgi:hypothetical protein
MINRVRARTRARGVHAFRVVKQLWGFAKVRYRAWPRTWHAHRLGLAWPTATKSGASCSRLWRAASGDPHSPPYRCSRPLPRAQPPRTLLSFLLIPLTTYAKGG